MTAVAAPHPRRLVLRVRGCVQGVGFRPFVYRRAVALGLRGAVWNEPDGVVIDVEGEPAALDRLRRELVAGPPRARVEAVEATEAPVLGRASFAIRESAGRLRRAPRVSPDLATCDACLAELRDPADRRHGYPFLNCTDCGPRYSIARDVPYDRPRTTMAAFVQCPACAAEYADPRSRRFHAQPNACAACGPRLWVEPEAAGAGRDPLDAALDALRSGRIVAVKGLGGFHLCCDARDPQAVRRLRERKHRPHKPLAVLFRDLEAAAKEVALDAASRDLLRSPRRPIVLRPWREPGGLAPGIAPGLAELGVLLPYTPLHQLLADRFGGPLVMTSGNRSGEPLAASNAQARERLAGVADLWLLHDREIHTPVDDSVVRVTGGEVRVLRRARGWVPEVLPLGFEAPAVLAMGADLKNTACLAADGVAVLGPHVGDLATPAARRVAAQVREGLGRLLGMRPRLLAHDLHPAHHGTAVARAAGLPALAVQHHHAHVASCLVEHGRTGPAIGVAWDGTGHGSDGGVWGGELLVADLAAMRRVGRLRPVALPGGDAAVREPWRMALSHLLASGLDTRRIGHPGRATLEGLVRTGWNAPPTSSAGRLFDAVAFLVGACPEPSYEGQAAAQLEARAAPDAPAYPLPLARRGDLLELDPRPLVRAVVDDLEAGAPPGRIAGRFHAALAEGIVRACAGIRCRTGLGVVVLTGGCFQNRLLEDRARRGLEAAGFRVLRHRRVPPGDGGISLGQAAVAAWRARHVPGDPR